MHRDGRRVRIFHQPLQHRAGRRVWGEHRAAQPLPLRAGGHVRLLLRHPPAHPVRGAARCQAGRAHHRGRPAHAAHHERAFNHLLPQPRGVGDARPLATAGRSRQPVGPADAHLGHRCRAHRHRGGPGGAQPGHHGRQRHRGLDPAKVHPSAFFQRHPAGRRDGGTVRAGGDRLRAGQREGRGRPLAPPVVLLPHRHLHHLAGGGLHGERLEGRQADVRHQRKAPGGPAALHPERLEPLGHLHQEQRHVFGRGQGNALPRGELQGGCHPQIQNQGIRPHDSPALSGAAGFPCPQPAYPFQYSRSRLR